MCLCLSVAAVFGDVSHVNTINKKCLRGVNGGNYVMKLRAKNYCVVIVTVTDDCGGLPSRPRFQ